MSGDEAWALLAYLTASAELCTAEPYYYGTFRLIEGASRLMGMMLESSATSDWLRDFKAEVDQKKLLVLHDREAFFAFLGDAAAMVAEHMPTANADDVRR